MKARALVCLLSLTACTGIDDYPLGQGIVPTDAGEPQIPTIEQACFGDGGADGGPNALHDEALLLRCSTRPLDEGCPLVIVAECLFTAAQGVFPISIRRQDMTPLLPRDE